MLACRISRLLISTNCQSTPHSKSSNFAIATTSVLFSLEHQFAFSKSIARRKLLHSGDFELETAQRYVFFFSATAARIPYKVKRDHGLVHHVTSTTSRHKSSRATSRQQLEARVQIELQLVGPVCRTAVVHECELYANLHP